MTNWESVAQHQHQRRHEQFISNGFFYSIRIVFNFSYLLFWKKRRERLKRWRRCNQRHGVLFIWRNSAVDEDETVLFRQKNIFVKIHKAVAICLMWSLVVIWATVFVRYCDEKITKTRNISFLARICTLYRCHVKTADDFYWRALYFEGIGNDCAAAQ